MSKRKAARFLRAAYQQFLRAAQEQSQSHLEGRIEALVFAAPKPMTARDLARVTGARRGDVERALAQLVEIYAPRGVQLVETSEGFTFLTNPAFGEEVRVVTGKKPVRMSRAQLETLAVIAYRQPVTRPEIDEVRGVDSGPVLRTLLDREIIRVIGKKEEPGRPLLYGTTEGFLKLLNIKSLSELPTLREFTELTDDSRETYERKLGESAPTGAIVFDDEPDESIDPTADDEDERDGRVSQDGEDEREGLGGDDEVSVEDDLEDEGLEDDEEGLEDDEEGLEDDEDDDGLEDDLEDEGDDDDEEEGLADEDDDEVDDEEEALDDDGDEEGLEDDEDDGDEDDEEDLGDGDELEESAG